MTAQARESLKYQDETLSLCGLPLDSYFELLGEDPPFMARDTALWRGYIGSWEILDGRLYLVGLGGYGQTGKDIDLSDLFPEYPERVFAHWVNGIFRAERGKLLKYEHAGFASLYEQDLFFGFEHGLLQSVEVKSNAVPASED
ncbi:hypothetical protein [Aestuariivirga litoralis]|nr:hypothetical protein [Aestuariivirga litoralis]